ncbi:hypothetical protein E2C01_028436 [Portunus trituberculatus]|uniref:Uncharacterized protein n=1 Tax=Portunus trituberculatus TaxID=210409 RepID=A0A5B7EP48_PORTR|nr:hypothetical protein [Portunus trituberculatus]
MASSPLHSNYSEMLGKISSRRADKMWSARVVALVTLLRRNCASARQNHVGTSIVEKGGSWTCVTAANRALPRLEGVEWLESSIWYSVESLLNPIVTDLSTLCKQDVLLPNRLPTHSSASSVR